MSGRFKWIWTRSLAFPAGSSLLKTLIWHRLRTAMASNFHLIWLCSRTWWSATFGRNDGPSQLLPFLLRRCLHRATAVWADSAWLKGTWGFSLRVGRCIGCCCIRCLGIWHRFRRASAACRRIFRNTCRTLRGRLTSHRLWLSCCGVTTRLAAFHLDAWALWCSRSCSLACPWSRASHWAGSRTNGTELQISWRLYLQPSPASLPENLDVALSATRTKEKASSQLWGHSH